MSLTYSEQCPEISVLVGKTFTKVFDCSSDELYFQNEAEEYKFYHGQDCCESVVIDDICGDLHDLENTPILEAYEANSDAINARDKDDDSFGSFTWTFYRFSTIK